jgi:hypothetical protein
MPMQSLTEQLYNNNVLFSYYGFIDNKVLDEVLQITKSKLESNKESVIVTKRVYDAIHDCIQNIIEHNFFPEGAILHYKSLIVVSHQFESYSINAINAINDLQKESINDQLTFLNSKSKDELVALRSQIVSKNKQQFMPDSAGLGLLDLVLQTDSCDYSFKSYKGNYLFNIHFNIGSQK